MIASSKFVSALALLVLLAGACSSTGSETEVASLQAGEVASLNDAADAAVIPDEDGPPTDPEEAALAFSQCMRDEGLDFPDLGVDAEGNIDPRAGFEAIDRRDDSVRASLDVCQELLSAGGFGGGRRADFQSSEVQDGLLAYTACIRDQGYDVGDLQLDQGPAQGPTADGDGAGAATAGDGGPAEGRRQGGFGSIADRFARQLGLDQTDPDVTTALEACQPALDEALSGTPLAADNSDDSDSTSDNSDS